MQFPGYNKITVSLVLLAVTILSGMLGFFFIDHYPLLDALYMSVIACCVTMFSWFMSLFCVSSVSNIFLMSLCAGFTKE